jgi:hypothetical protein
MKSLKMILPIAILFTALTACNKHLFGSIKGKGDNVTEVRPLTNFNKVKLSIDADILYVQDSTYYVEISAQSNVLGVMTTKVSAGELEFDFKKWVRKHNPITIIIHSPEIKGFHISGSGNINIQNEIVTDDMDLHVSGSGNISMYSLQSQDLEVSISGSGDINIGGGNVNNQKVTISGSGDVDALELMANYSNSKISGSGSITVHAVQQLDATISGSGDIRYAGQPIVNTHISGSGSVIHL